LLMYCMYCSLAVAGITSNLIVCYIIVSSQRMRTATNLFLINLAVGDIMMSCLCIPFAFVSNLIYQYWPFGSVMCVVVSYAQANSVFVSAYTMVAISIDRYLAIMYPMRLRMTKLQAKILIAVIWSAAVLTSLPTALLSGLAPISGSEHESCVEQWDNPDSRYYYSMALMVLQYFLPLLVLVITYTRIGIVVWGKRTPGEAENARDARIARSKRKLKC
ncbi:RYamide receptor, partial [Fragariocoptes setiger]